MVKLAIAAAVGAFVLFYIITSPSQAVDIAHGIGHLTAKVAHGIGQFIDKLDS